MCAVFQTGYRIDWSYLRCVGSINKRGYTPTTTRDRVLIIIVLENGEYKRESILY